MAEDASRFIWIITTAKESLLRLDPKIRVAEVVPKTQAPSRITSSPLGMVYLLSFLSGEISILRDGQAWEDVPLPLARGQVEAFLLTMKTRCSWPRVQDSTGGKIGSGLI